MIDDTEEPLIPEIEQQMVESADGSAATELPYYLKRPEVLERITAKTNPAYELTTSLELRQIACHALSFQHDPDRYVQASKPHIPSKSATYRRRHRIRHEISRFLGVWKPP